MGMMNRYDCICGYHRDLEIGGGLNSNREDSVRRVFDDAALSAFDKAKQDGKLTRFFWENLPGACPACKELVATPVLHYWLGTQEHTIQKPCAQCGGVVSVQREAPTCPKCGKGLAEAQSGHWD